ncbi:MAG: hypothetical protein ACREQ9_23765 [Candidatus Binatia bacterium]
MFPFLILLSVQWLAEAGPSGRRAVMGCAALALSGAFATTSIADALAFSRPDTRFRAREWCRRNLVPGSRVLGERYVLSVDRRDLREAAFRDFTSAKTHKAIGQGVYDVVITSSLAHDRYFDALSPEYNPGAQSSYRLLRERYVVLAEFRDRRLDFAHPVITIYGYRAPKPRS